MVDAKRSATMPSHPHRIDRSAPPPWRDLAAWSAVIGPIVGFGFVAYFVHAIVMSVSH
jgi:hypothetical protein